MTTYPPYVNAYLKIPTLFSGIKTAAVPPKVSNDFLYSKLELKSTGHRAFIPLLKRLGFIDDAQSPTQMYRDYREETKSKAVLAQGIKKAYSELYSAHEYAHTLGKPDVLAKLVSSLGVSKDDVIIPKVAATFGELIKLADFDAKIATSTDVFEKEGESQSTEEKTVAPINNTTKLGISYTINLNMPATTDVAVFDAIFKALKENMLR